MEGGEGNYRTSSTPIWVCVSFSPHLARRRKSALTGDLLVRLVVGLRFHRLFEAWWVGGLRDICIWLSWWATISSPLRGLGGGWPCGIFAFGSRGGIQLHRHFVAWWVVGLRDVCRQKNLLPPRKMDQ